MGRAGWGRDRKRAGLTAGREAVLERRTREVGRRTRSTAEGRVRRRRAARLEGEQKGVLLFPATESLLNRYPDLPSRRNRGKNNAGLMVPGRRLVLHVPVYV